MTVPTSSDPLRILVVTDDEEVGSAIAARLGGNFAAGLRTCARPEHAAAQARSHRAEVVVLALASLDAVERHALAIRAGNAAVGARPFLLALCNGARFAAAARLCRDDVIDDYVQHFPMPSDPDRLATSLRLAARVVAPTRVPASTAPVAATAPAATAAAPRRKSLVLVFDDDEVQHALVGAMLESESIELVFETDGATALERIRAVGPDLVVMDVMLSDFDGVTLTEQIKAESDLAAIPVVMLTGEARLDTLVRSMEAGAADFIVKPFTRESLVAKLGKFLPV